MERETTIDISKGIGIMLVVAGHSIAIYGGKFIDLHDFIYSFHMPLFFAISGFYISDKKKYSTFIIEKAERLLIPFAFWVSLSYFTHQIIQLIKINASNFITINNMPSFLSIEDLIEMLFVANYAVLYSRKICGFLWFLPVLFSLLIIRRSIINFDKKISAFNMFLLSIIISALILKMNNKFMFHKLIPFGIDTALVCLPFVFILYFKEKLYKINIFIMPILIILIIWLKQDFGVSDLRIKNISIFYLLGIIGTICILRVSFSIKDSIIGRIFNKIGNFTYSIYILHEFVFIYWRPVASRIDILKSWEVLQITSFILGVIIPIGITKLIRKSQIFKYFAFGERSHT